MIGTSAINHEAHDGHEDTIRFGTGFTSVSSVAERLF